MLYNHSTLIISRKYLPMYEDQAVKVDVDAMFLHIRLCAKLIAQVAMLVGIYPASCKYVDYGVFGKFEVVRHRTAQFYIALIDDCLAPLSHACGDA